MQMTMAQRHKDRKRHCFNTTTANCLQCMGFNTKHTRALLRAALSLCFAFCTFAQSVDIIGRDYGVSSHTQDVDEVQARKVVMDAEQGLHTDALYFSGLLWLYGKGGITQVRELSATPVTSNLYAKSRTHRKRQDCDHQRETRV